MKKRTIKETLYSVLCLMTGICTLSGCIEEFEADIPSGDSDLLVVEGTICSSKTNKFILSRTQTINATHIPQTVTGAKVSVRGTDGSELMAQPADGYYSCQVGDLSPEVDYYLHIETDGDIYESEPQKPLRTEKIADIRGVQSTPEGPIDILITPEAPFVPDITNYYSWTYDETWEIHSDYTTNMYFDKEEMKPIYKANYFPSRGWKNAVDTANIVGTSTSYEGQHIQRLKIYGIDCSNERIHHRYSGLVHQRAITKNEYEYLLACRQAGSEMGGLFTPLPSALPTNIRCLTSDKHVIGYVGCSMNTSEYRFFLNASDYNVLLPHWEDARLWLEYCSEDDCCRLVDAGMFLCEWQDTRFSPQGMLRTAWAYEKQLDVRYKGAYIEEPDFWSLEENVSY